MPIPTFPKWYTLVLAWLYVHWAPVGSLIGFNKWNLKSKFFELKVLSFEIIWFSIGIIENPVESILTSYDPLNVE